MFSGRPGAITAKEGAVRRKTLRDGKKVSTVYDPRAPVFFMIGSQRSGSNWELGAHLAENERIFIPFLSSKLKLAGHATTDAIGCCSVFQGSFLSGHRGGSLYFRCITAWQHAHMQAAVPLPEEQDCGAHPRCR